MRGRHRLVIESDTGIIHTATHPGGGKTEGRSHVLDDVEAGRVYSQAEMEAHVAGKWGA